MKKFIIYTVVIFVLGVGTGMILANAMTTDSLEERIEMQLQG